MKKERINIQRENGEIVVAQAPVIISASRSTDIPAFYADWFFHRLKIGYSAWINPYNGSRNYISYQNTRFIVFWSKNPKPMIPYFDKLKGYTEKLVFSFADISSYRKVKYNLEHNNVHYHEFDENSMSEFAAKLSQLNKKWGYTLTTCGEKIDFEKFGILHNRCIDDDLMIKYFSDDQVLMKHLGVEIQEGGLFDPVQIVRTKDNKDKGQRLLCGCITSKNIGEYNTCPHQCEYCYANTTKELATLNWKNHQTNKYGETITGR